ncbi:bifunctional class I SAM-dependent methyltransferase/glycosyltransferase family 2 protein [Opitutus sp. ER46]|uniref:bifunctional class I SAM-dependent methyltransferase/glycosyltransferase family 2 protein n=1 Tax=Opitutus sp. ER46 TaxID=2161864 RepID=UPI000D30AF5D|nr:bifunctional class I SAM-dependent methyltransferase/glycosyltransferase family 2 protein [Opitutus sp. ER46]PTX92613.1 glycosyl transferase [Opitutus sp. ER46]
MNPSSSTSDLPSANVTEAQPDPVVSTSQLVQRHLNRVREFYDCAPVRPQWAARQYRRLLSHYYNLLIAPSASVLEIGCGGGDLLALIRAGRRVGVDLSAKRIEAARQQVPDAEFYVQAGEELSLEGKFDVIIISDTLNLAADVQQLLERLHGVATPDTRLLINFQNTLWRPFLSLAQALGLKAAQPQNSWLASADVRNLLRLADWEVVLDQNRILVPSPVLGLGSLVNRWLAPLLQWFCLTIFFVARPQPRTPRRARTVSVVIPARNEAGNIEAAVQRTPELGAGTELIFVEGNSTDHTWAEIQRVAAAYPQRNIRILQQPGRGKGDAVRAGFAVASGDILMILDADLTMPPEELPKFYAVLASGRAEFANGVRLVYPMEQEAMQFANLCANKAFGLIFSWLLGQPVKDTLCGTKVLARAHYERVAANRTYFGDFDPFGDFDLLFGAAKLNLKIADVPIRYQDRTYGTTNIQRWRHGWLLLRMVMFAARKLKFV